MNKINKKDYNNIKCPKLDNKLLYKYRCKKCNNEYITLNIFL